MMQLPQQDSHGQVLQQSQRYYAENADTYAESTLDFNLSPLYKKFLALVPKGGLILDAGSGSGRDTLAFIEQGYLVEAFDASSELADISSRLTGLSTQVLRFQDFSEIDRYDGIWACASLLHVPKDELASVLLRLINGLKTDGVFYMSFKHGSSERIADDGRFYNDLSRDEMITLLSKIDNIRIEDVWLTEGESRLKGKGDWVNAIVKKISRKEGA